MKEFLPFIALRSPSWVSGEAVSKSMLRSTRFSLSSVCRAKKPAAKLAVVEGSCSASCEALSKCCRIDSGKSSRLLATFGHDAGVSLDDLLESRDGSDSGFPVLGRTALGDCGGTWSLTEMWRDLPS